MDSYRFRSPLTDEAGTKKLAETAMEKIAQKKYKEGYEVISAYWSIPKQEISNSIYRTENYLGSPQKATIETWLGLSVLVHSLVWRTNCSSRKAT